MTSIVKPTNITNIPAEVYINHILPYVVERQLKLLDWIPIDKLDWGVVIQMSFIF